VEGSHADHNERLASLPWFMGDQTTVGGSDSAREVISVVGSRKYTLCRSCVIRSVVFDETQEKCCFCAVTYQHIRCVKSISV